MTAAPAWEPEPLPAPPERHLTVVPPLPESPDVPVPEPIDLDELVAAEPETGGPGDPPPPRPPATPRPRPAAQRGRLDDGLLIPAALVVAFGGGVTIRVAGFVIGAIVLVTLYAALILLIGKAYPRGAES